MPQDELVLKRRFTKALAMHHLSADQLAHITEQVTASDMHTVLMCAAVKLDGVDVGMPMTAAIDATLLLQQAALRARNAVEVAELLTDRELQICRLLHYENTKIGVLLDVTTHTVRAHVRAALAKTGAETRTELALLTHGIIQRISPRANTNVR